MDQGIIKNLKVHYRRQVIQKQLVAIDNRMDLVLNVLDALLLLRNLGQWLLPKQSVTATDMQASNFKTNSPLKINRTTRTTTSLSPDSSNYSRWKKTTLTHSRTLI
jgi:hypothetical protein